MPVFGLPPALESSLNSLIDLRPPNSWRVSGHGRQEVTVVVRWTLHVSSPSSDKTLHYDDVDKIQPQPARPHCENIIDPQKNFPINRNLDGVSGDINIVLNRHLDQSQHRRHISQTSNSSGENSIGQSYSIDNDEFPVAKKQRRLSSPYRLYRNPSFASSISNLIVYNGKPRDGKCEAGIPRKNTISKDRARSAFRAAYPSFSGSLSCEADTASSGHRVHDKTENMNRKPQRGISKAISFEENRAEKIAASSDEVTARRSPVKTPALPGFQHIEAEKMAAFTEHINHHFRATKPLYPRFRPNPRCTESRESDLIVCEPVPPSHKNCSNDTQAHTTGSTSYNTPPQPTSNVESSSLLCNEKLDQVNNLAVRENLQPTGNNYKSVHTQMKTVQHIFLPNNIKRQSMLASSNTVEHDKALQNGIRAYLAQCGSSESSQQEITDLVDHDEEGDDDLNYSIHDEEDHARKSPLNAPGKEELEKINRESMNGKDLSVLDEKSGVLLRSETGHKRSDESICESLSDPESPSWSLQAKESLQKEPRHSFQEKYVATLERQMKRRLRRQKSSNAEELDLKRNLENDETVHSNGDDDVMVVLDTAEDLLEPNHYANTTDGFNGSVGDNLLSLTAQPSSDLRVRETVDGSLTEDLTDLQPDPPRIPSHDTEDSLEDKNHATSHSLTIDIEAHNLVKETDTGENTSDSTVCQDELTEENEQVPGDETLSNVEDLCNGDDHSQGQCYVGEKTIDDQGDQNKDSDSEKIIENSFLIEKARSEANSGLREEINMSLEEERDENCIETEVDVSVQSEEILQDLARCDSPLEETEARIADTDGCCQPNSLVDRSCDSHDSNQGYKNEDGCEVSSNLSKIECEYDDSFYKNSKNRYKHLKRNRDSKVLTSANSNANNESNSDEASQAKLIIDEEKTDDLLDEENSGSGSPETSTSKNKEICYSDEDCVNKQSNSFGCEKIQNASSVPLIVETPEPSSSDIVVTDKPAHRNFSLRNASSSCPTAEHFPRHSPRYTTDYSDMKYTSATKHSGCVAQRKPKASRKDHSHDSPYSAPQKSPHRSSRKKSKAPKRKGSRFSLSPFPNETFSYSPAKHEKRRKAGSTNNSPYQSPLYLSPTVTRQSSRATSRRASKEDLRYRHRNDSPGMFSLGQSPKPDPQREKKKSFTHSIQSSPSNMHENVKDQDYLLHSSQESLDTASTHKGTYHSQLESSLSTAALSPQVSLVRVDHKLHSAPKKRFRQTFYNQDNAASRSTNRNYGIVPQPSPPQQDCATMCQVESSNLVFAKYPKQANYFPSEHSVPKCSSPEFSSPEFRLTAGAIRDHSIEYMPKSSPRQHTTAFPPSSHEPASRSKRGSSKQPSPAAVFKGSPDYNQGEDGKEVRDLDSPHIHSNSESRSPSLHSSHNVRASSERQESLNSTKQNTFDTSSSPASPAPPSNESPLGFACESFEHLPESSEMKLDDSSSDEASIRPPTPVPSV
ncbi:mediator of RNA polymerase ii transcription subunit 20 [Plakobranchus ocellatus]|uniref:Mediator of RNA polymerase ii transcription subunit 20 n=1 Tax=Plakobranchus ocellatus TaxID=259542 RepID=A0AAV4DJZ6_9GAST|nr:mediator of RNA polymerase ii transcription subunit 20 [Plakobranchus ocellatus]